MPLLPFSLCALVCGWNLRNGASWPLIRRTTPRQATGRAMHLLLIASPCCELLRSRPRRDATARCSKAQLPWDFPPCVYSTWDGHTPRPRYFQSNHVAKMVQRRDGVSLSLNCFGGDAPRVTFELSYSYKEDRSAYATCKRLPISYHAGRPQAAQVNLTPFHPSFCPL